MKLSNDLQHLIEIIACKPLLTRKDLCRRYGKSLSTIDRWHHDGTLPRATYLRNCPLPFWKPMDLQRAESRQPELQRALCNVTRPPALAPGKSRRKPR